MKTNHQRNYKDEGSFRDRSCTTLVSKLTGKEAYIGNDFTDGHRGHAKAVRGAKKFIRSRDRLYHKKLTRNWEEE